MTEQLEPHSKTDPEKSASKKHSDVAQFSSEDSGLAQFLPVSSEDSGLAQFLPDSFEGLTIPSAFPEDTYNWWGKSETLGLLLPIAEKWRIIGREMGLNSKELGDIENKASSNERRLETMLGQHQQAFKNHSKLYHVLIAMGESEVAESLTRARWRPPFIYDPLSAPDEWEYLVPLLDATKRCFSNLLNAMTRTVKHKPPRELAHMIGCFDKRFTALLNDCRDTNDVITALIHNVTFLDYDLLRYLADTTDDKALQSDLKMYTTKLDYYLEKKTELYTATFTIDKDMGILPGDKRSIDKLERILTTMMKRTITVTFSDDFNKPRKLKGVNVLKEVEVTVRKSALIFNWEGYGIKLTVPESALIADKLTITIRASLSGQYSFPDGTQLVSPIFWLSCKKFLDPLSLEIQHCALPENSFRLFMVKAICTQKDLPYNFKPLFGGTFTKHSSYGAIELNRFSGVGVVQERIEERRYWSSVFYMGPSNSKNIHFTVTWHTDAHITAIKSHYKSRKAEPGPEQALVFKEESITLDVPKEGLDINDGWKVIPATPPEIEKKEVDDHSHENQTVPHCELLAKWLKDRSQAKTLTHTVNIHGTTKEKYFVISIDPERTTVEEADKESIPSKLKIRHLFNICECLKNLPNEDLIVVGLALGLHYPTLKKMQKFPEDMVEAWLLQRDSVTHSPTTETLIQALEKSGFTGTADVIKTKFM